MADQVILQFSTSFALASKLIRMASHSDFSHVDFVLEDGSLLGASDQGPRGVVIAGNPEGVAIRPANYQEFGIRRRMCIKTPKADAIMAVAMGELGKPFDSSALYAVVSDELGSTRQWQKDSAWFCSELVAHAFDEGGYWAPLEFINPKNRITPADLILLFQFDINVINRSTFLRQIEGLTLGSKEK